ncbi:hypothetical protein CVV38_01180 [Candidatus Peregrinibacteria bacterium HGW-Peregrinibacteria-1]|nr:MAG: hypothetical protein CVV38_01180 [Candidatus Peregrinibacteria bacterium HGW-Peregrinibacteria-1]
MPSKKERDQQLFMPPRHRNGKPKEINRKTPTEPERDKVIPTQRSRNSNRLLQRSTEPEPKFKIQSARKKEIIFKEQLNNKHSITQK